MTTRTKVERLLERLRTGAYEREEAIGLSFLSAAAGESIFLLGLPGVAKSMIARRLSLAFKDARRFEYLMSRFSTPDEIFGPVSISKLKDSDTYERVVDGYLPTADVAFLDEIWKAGPAIQNSLLTALNEKLFRNGREDMSLPLKGIIAASNELPAQGEGLEALWDRFLIRYIVDPIRDKENFLSLLDGQTSTGCYVPAELQFSAEEMKAFLEERDKVVLPGEILEFIYSLRSKYAVKAQEALKDKAAARSAGVAAGGTEDEDDNVPYVSDRRWKKIVGILRTSALLNGRTAVDWSDCLLLEHLIWDNDSQTTMVRDDIARLLVKAVLQDADTKAGDDLWRQKPRESGDKEAPKPFWSPDGGKHYAFEAGGELMLIAAADYERIAQGIFFGSFGDDNIVKVSASPAEFKIRRTKPGHITINSFSYPLRTEGAAPIESKDFVKAVLSPAISTLEVFRKEVADNLFTRPFNTYKAILRETRRYGSRTETKKTR